MLQKSKKIIIVTGSSKGIGMEISKRYLDNKSFFLILNSRKNNKFIIETTKKYSDVKFIRGDINKILTQKKIIKFLKYKKFLIDGLICNVGGGKNPKNGKEKIINYKNSFDINFYSAVNTIYNLKNYFKKHAKVVCISSIASKSIVNTPIAYSVAKSALNSFIINFAKNYKKNKICITGILPGHVMHKNSVWFKKKNSDPKLIKDMLKNHMPTSVWIKSSDIANLTSFLMEHSTNSFNGSLIELDGGITTK